jgi:hypothetical protein
MGQHPQIVAALIILTGYYSLMMIAYIARAKAAKKTVVRRYSNQHNKV